MTYSHEVCLLHKWHDSCIHTNIFILTRTFGALCHIISYHVILLHPPRDICRPPTHATSNICDEEAYLLFLSKRDSFYQKKSRKETLFVKKRVKKRLFLSQRDTPRYICRPPTHATSNTCDEEACYSLLHFECHLISISNLNRSAPNAHYDMLYHFISFEISYHDMKWFHISSTNTVPFLYRSFSAKEPYN